MVDEQISKVDKTYKALKDKYVGAIQEKNEARVRSRLATMRSVADLCFTSDGVGPKGAHPDLLDPSLLVYLMTDADIIKAAEDCMPPSLCLRHLWCTPGPPG